MTAEHPEDWTPGDDVDVQAAIKKIRAGASDRSGDYAAGMRYAASILEEELDG